MASVHFGRVLAYLWQTLVTLIHLLNVNCLNSTVVVSMDLTYGCSVAKDLVTFVLHTERPYVSYGTCHGELTTKH